MRLGCRLTLGLGLCAAVLTLGVAGAHADSKTTFGGAAKETQLAALETQSRLVAAGDLAGERAMGLTPGVVAAPEESSEVAVILWDDAWSGLQRRAPGASAGSNAGTSIAGSSGN